MKELNKKDLNSIELNPLLSELRSSSKVGKGQNCIFESFDQTQIFYRKWKPKGKVQQIIITCHGMSGHGEYFVILADKLVPDGAMVIAIDYRNHGYSDGKKGDIKSFKNILKDLNVFQSYIELKYPETPVFLFGQSMGGTVIINYAEYYQDSFARLNGIILTSPAIKIGFSKSQWLLAGLAALFLMPIRLLLPSLRIIPARGGEEKNIRNSIHIQYDKDDPLHLDKLSLRYLLQAFKHIRKCKKIAEKITIPALGFHGGADTGISPQGTASFFEKIASQDKKFICIKEGLHALITDDLFENQWEIIMQWINEHS